jgi:hypothetical protein
METYAEAVGQLVVSSRNGGAAERCVPDALLLPGENSETSCFTSSSEGDARF